MTEHSIASDKPSDLEIKRAQKNAGYDLENVLAATSPYILALCRSWCHPPLDPTDIAQESLIRVANNLGSFEFRSSFFSWVYTLTYRTFLDFFRREQRRRSIVEISQLPDNFDAGALTTDDIDTDLLNECLNRLDPHHHDILILIDVHELSYLQASQQLHIPVGTVRSRVARARIALRKLMNDLPSDGTNRSHHHVLNDEEI